MINKIDTSNIKYLIRNIRINYLLDKNNPHIDILGSLFSNSSIYETVYGGNDFIYLHNEIYGYYLYMDIEDGVITFDYTVAREFFEGNDGFGAAVGEFIKFYINLKISSEHFKNIEYVNISGINREYEGLKSLKKIGYIN